MPQKNNDKRTGDLDGNNLQMYDITWNMTVNLKIIYMFFLWL